MRLSIDPNRTRCIRENRFHDSSFGVQLARSEPLHVTLPMRFIVVQRLLPLSALMLMIIYPSVYAPMNCSKDAIM